MENRRFFRVTRTECPNTRAEFVEKWNSDVSFRLRAQSTGFNVVGDNVIFPDGRIANHRIK